MSERERIKGHQRETDRGTTEIERDNGGGEKKPRGATNVTPTSVSGAVS